MVAFCRFLLLVEVAIVEATLTLLAIFALTHNSATEMFFIKNFELIFTHLGCSHNQNFETLFLSILINRNWSNDPLQTVNFFIPMKSFSISNFQKQNTHQHVVSNIESIFPGDGFRMEQSKRIVYTTMCKKNMTPITCI